MEEYQNQNPEPPVNQADQEENDARFRSARHAYSGALLNLMLYGLLGQLLVVIVFSLFRLMSGGKTMPESMQYLWSFGLSYFVLFPLYLLLSRFLESKPPEKHSMKPGHFVIALIMCFAFMVVGAVFGNLVNLFFSFLFGFQIDASSLTSGILGENYLLLSCIATFGAPIVEELMFRKVFIDRVRKFGDGTAILLSGIMFGLYHGNFSQCFFAAGLGLFFAFIYVRTGKIQYTIAMHMIVNFLGSFVSGLILRGIDLESLMGALSKGNFAEIFQYLPKMIPLFCFEIVEYGLAIAGIVLLIVNHKKFRVAPPEVPLQKGTQFKAACLNLGFLLLVLFCVFLFVFTALQLMGVISK